MNLEKRQEALKKAMEQMHKELSEIFDNSELTHEKALEQFAMHSRKTYLELGRMLILNNKP